jgi:hypothetical protein
MESWNRIKNHREPDYDILYYIILSYGFSKFSILIGSQAVRKNPYPDRGPYFPYLDRCPGCRLSGGNFCFANRKIFCFLTFKLCFTDKNFKQPNCFWLSMHAYRILLPSETDDSRFNSREKLTDSVQPYNKPIIDLACSVCTVKYQTSVFCMDLAPSPLGPYWKTSVRYFTVQTSRSVNKPLLFHPPYIVAIYNPLI